MHVQPAPVYWTIRDVATTLERSPTWVRQHDEQLQPFRASDGTRLYDPARVEAYAALRKRVGAR